MKKEEDELSSTTEEPVSPAQTPPKPKPEVRKASAEQRAVLAGLLIGQANDLAKEARERKVRKSQEVIELHSGEKITLGALTALVTPQPRPYVALFPNKVPFFRELSRLSGLNFDPNVYTKPNVVGRWLCELIYNRFTKEVLPALRALNPRYTNGARGCKHFQYLTPEAEVQVIQFRDEAIDEMLTSSNMPEFRQKMHQKYGVPYQADLF